MVNSRTVDGPICPNCRPLPILICSICGRTAPCTLSKLTGPPRCGGCDRRAAHCTVCGRLRGIHSGSTADAPVCGPCTTPDAELWLPCPTCGQAERLHAPGPCPRCTLKQRLHEFLATDTGAIPTNPRASSPLFCPISAPAADPSPTRPWTNSRKARSSNTSAASSWPPAPCRNGTSRWSDSNGT